jgi:indole-3-glycerol phosphate synthase
LPELKAAARGAAPARPFAVALRQPTLSVIAEVKRSSPSKGAIAPALDAAEQAAAYAAGGAVAISVLTEPTRFGGAMEDLERASARVAVPVIRKDFLVHPVQLWEARAAGASAALLIVRALSPDELARMMDAIQDAGLEALVEVRDERELARALAVNARVIGVNNRNLETLIIDVSTAPGVIPSIPADRIAVAESGLRTAEDMTPAAHAGADAVLVGSAVSADANPSDAVRALTTVPRHDRRP